MSITNIFLYFVYLTLLILTHKILKYILLIIYKKNSNEENIEDRKSKYNLLFDLLSEFYIVSSYVTMFIYYLIGLDFTTDYDRLNTFLLAHYTYEFIFSYKSNDFALITYNLFLSLVHLLEIKFFKLELYFVYRAMICVSRELSNFMFNAYFLFEVACFSHKNIYNKYLLFFKIHKFECLKVCHTVFIIARLIFIPTVFVILIYNTLFYHRIILLIEFIISLSSNLVLYYGQSMLLDSMYTNKMKN